MARLRRGEGRGFRFVARDRTETYFPYEDLEAEAHRRAALLAQRGLRKGDRVALVIPEPHEFVLSFLGAVVAGVVPVPIFPRASFKNVDGYVDVLAHIIKTSGASLTLCMESNREIVDRVIPLGVEAPIGDVTVIFAEEPQGEYAPPSIAPEDLCFLQFTSGSTSKPKGVMVTHRNLVANACAFLGPNGLDRTDDDLGVSWLPLFHDMGLIGFVLGTLVCDIPVVILPTESFARSPMLWLETISAHRGTITYAPNFAYELLTKRVKARHLESLDLSSLRVAGCGAEPIRAKSLLGFAEKLAPAGFDPRAFLPSYGMAEATLAITFHPLGDEMVVDQVDPAAMQDAVARPAGDDVENPLSLVACGRPFPKHEVKIIDEAGNALGERRVGQVITRGPSVTSGYFENEEASADGFRDGWLYTGDLGYFAGEDLYICGRVKDLIIIRGANHHPQDIEWSVSDLAGVRRGNVFAFSVMNDGVEELIVAAEGNRADAERLRTEIAQTITREHGITPKSVLVLPVGTLPKTSSGKAQRRKTKLMFERGELAAHP